MTTDKQPGDNILSAEGWAELNRSRTADAMKLLYDTYIVDETQAEARGVAIRALDAFLVALGGAVLSSQIESVSYSKRLRDSGEPELIALEQEIRKSFGGNND